LDFVGLGAQGVEDPLVLFLRTRVEVELDAEVPAAEHRSVDSPGEPGGEVVPVDRSGNSGVREAVILAQPVDQFLEEGPEPFAAELGARALPRFLPLPANEIF